MTLVPGTGQFRINGRTLEDYFPRESLRSMIQVPLQLAGIAGRYDVTASLSGGGVAGQAGALRHGISRAVQMLDPGHRPAGGQRDANHAVNPLLDAREPDQRPERERGFRLEIDGRIVEGLQHAAERNG